MASRVWAEGCQDRFVRMVAAILRDWKAGEIDADEAMSEVSHEYADKIGELE